MSRPIQSVLLAVLFLISSSAAKSDNTGEKPQALVQKLGADSYAERQEAARKLLELGPSVGNILEDTARTSQDPEVSNQASEILRKLPARHRWTDPPKLDLSRIKPIVEKAGELSDSESWTSDKSYLVKSDLRIAGRAVVTIEQGTMVFVAEGVSINVDKDAAIVAKAKEHWNPIVITADGERTGKEGYWGKLVVRGGVAFENVQVRRSSGIEYTNELQKSMGMDGLLLLKTKGNALTFHDNGSRHGEIAVRDTDGVAFTFDRSAYPSLKRLEVVGATKGILGNKGYPDFEVVAISDVSEEGILLRSGRVTIKKSLTIRKCQIGIYFHGGATGGSVSGEFQTAEIFDCAESGVIIKHSNPKFSSLTIDTTNKTGVHMSEECYPVIGALTLRDIAGTALIVEGGSQSRIGEFRTVRCNKPERIVQEGSAIGDLREEDRRPFSQ